MIIPVKCYTCGKVIADKYRYYLSKVREKKLEEQEGGKDGDVVVDKVLYLTRHNIRKTAEGQVLDDIGFTKMCCRRHFLTHVDIQ
jgi:DNA-directed RNA polymerase I, II, and III subunit RPABC5